MRYKYKVRELGPRQLGMQKEEYVEVGEAKDMEAMSFKKLRRKLDPKKEYNVEYTNKHNNFISTTISGIQGKL